MPFKINFLTLCARFSERGGVVGAVWNLEDKVF